MPITFNCSCGKTLQVKDDLAGRRVRCPGCQGAATVPVPDLGFEVVDDVPPAPAPAKPAPVRAVTAERSDDEDDRPRKRRRDDDEDDDRPRKRRQDDDEDDRPRGRRRDDDEDDDRPRGRRRDDDDDRSRDDDDDRPRKKKNFRKKEKDEQKPSHFGMEKSILNGGVAGGLLAMLGAVVWCVGGLLLFDRFFIYTPILFVIGLIALIKGMVGGGEE